MAIQVLRQCGRPVPKWAQDPESDEYILWLRGLYGLKDDEFSCLHLEEHIGGYDPKGNLILDMQNYNGVWRQK